MSWRRRIKLRKKTLRNWRLSKLLKILRLTISKSRISMKLTPWNVMSTVRTLWELTSVWCWPDLLFMSRWQNLTVSFKSKGISWWRSFSVTRPSTQRKWSLLQKPLEIPWETTLTTLWVIWTTSPPTKWSTHKELSKDMLLQLKIGPWLIQTWETLIHFTTLHPTKST